MALGWRRNFVTFEYPENKWILIKFYKQIKIDQIKVRLETGPTCLVLNTVMAPV